MTELILKITELAELITPATNDLLVVVDVSEALEINQTKHIKVENLTVNTAVILAAVYPVGSIYVSALSTNPGTLFGFGTWSAFGAGRVLVGIDVGQTEFDVALETGGAKTHTLSAAEMPVHTHVQNAHTHTQDAHSHIFGEDGKWYAPWDTGSSEYSIRTNGATTNPGAAATATNQNTTAVNQNAGSGSAHNNLQPYIVVYMWRRTA